MGSFSDRNLSQASDNSSVKHLQSTSLLPFQNVTLDRQQRQTRKININGHSGVNYYCLTTVSISSCFCPYDFTNVLSPSFLLRYSVGLLLDCLGSKQHGNLWEVFC